MTPEEGLEYLKEGNARFVAGTPKHHDVPANVRRTATGQYPFAAILSCMDSRGPVELMFDLTVGDAFSLRLAGNVVNADVLGSLEFATKIAGTELVLVLGHTRCGAVKGAIDGVVLGSLTGLLARISPAVRAAGAGSSEDDAYLERVAERNVRLSMRELQDKSPVLRELITSGSVRLAGAIYDIVTGKVRFLPD